jgi:hypothetical protein
MNKGDNEPLIGVAARDVRNNSIAVLMTFDVDGNIIVGVVNCSQVLGGSSGDLQHPPRQTWTQSTKECPSKDK